MPQTHLPESLDPCNSFHPSASKRIAEDVRNIHRYEQVNCRRLTILGSSCTSFIFALIVATSLLAQAQDFLKPSIPNSLSNLADQVSKCDACKTLIKSFEKGIDDTSRGKHEGGDTSWEERNLKNYADSEVRLVEIQEKICEDVNNGKQQCLAVAEEAESDLEDWWFNQRNKNVRLMDFLCIARLKRCCPSKTFGPTCQPCPNDCNKHGSCNGSGTREGTGECECDSGYIGSECNNCDENYYRATTTDNFICRQCDSACIGCHGPGPMNCTDCKPGFQKHERDGCVDVNECDQIPELCKDNTYCVNLDGSFRCADCHVSCSGCIGYGSSMCKECAIGYEMDDENTCQNEEEMERLRDQESILLVRNALTRYIVYALIMVVSVMMFRSNMYVMCTFLSGFVIFLLITGFFRHE